MDIKEQERILQEEVGHGIEVSSVQPISIVDHVMKCDADTMKTLITDETGGSHRVPLSEIQRILSTVGEYFSKAGGSASNVIRGLAGFGVKSKLVGSRGQDEWGALFNSSMKRAGVNVDDIKTKEGNTGRCCILSYEGQRTMRTCLDNTARLDPSELEVSHFAGTKFVFLSGYCLYNEGLLERCVDIAQAVGAKIALDLASFEIVRYFRSQLHAIISSGAVSICFCNEDEAKEWAGGTPGVTPEQGLDLLAQYCDIAVTTLGEKGCLVKEKGAEETIAQPACSGVVVVDTTGAGDLFASGFLYSILRGYSLKRASEIGCLAGGAVVQTLGSEMTPSNWHWLHQRLHGELAAETVRSSAIAVQQELLACYALIERKGRGVVYYGSARLRDGSEHWTRSRALGAAVAELLNCTTWTGGGPGMMEAATLGAMDAGYQVAGIRIGREAGTTVRTASYLPSDSAVVCRFLSSRKVALVDGGVRMKETDKTAFIFLPGGLGTMDELFEILCLMQLKKLGTRFPVPLVLCNFPSSSGGTSENNSGGGGGFYDGLLEFTARCVEMKTVGLPELKDVLIAADEHEVLDALAEFYGIERNSSIDSNGVVDGDSAHVDGKESKAKKKLVRASDWVEAKLGL
jgi:sugar/nucleoside kinase (ribokinase family)/predicted Rossmann-fold nucleotide-binding protein